MVVNNVMSEHSFYSSRHVESFLRVTTSWEGLNNDWPLPDPMHVHSCCTND